MDFHLKLQVIVDATCGVCIFTVHVCRIENRNGICGVLFI